MKNEELFTAQITDIIKTMINENTASFRKKLREFMKEKTQDKIVFEAKKVLFSLVEMEYRKPKYREKF